MPKMKTHKGSAKRFRRTGTGKIMRAKAFKSHILTKKSQKRIRAFRKEAVLGSGDAKVVSQRMGSKN
ncbi:MAG: 50S ribosomal protein L35 [Atopobiaceae bacterium]|jgi:large subunit ribosomal protein L35|nr:50S ribosomal protein L35 [Olegusella sp.]MCI1934251.1 50S ribosomal protein L35 [Atopobiaceae bacterium]